MEPDEANRHRVRRQLLSTLAHLRDANRALYLAEEHSKLCRSYSDGCSGVHNNVDALRAGLEETVKFIAHEAERIKRTMESPSAKPPPIRGAYLQAVRRHTPLQLDLARQGLLTLTPIRDYKADVPKHETPPSPPKIPTIIPFTPYKGPRKNKPRTRKKEGIVPV